MAVKKEQKNKSVTQKVHEDKNVNSTNLVEENANLKEQLDEMMKNYKEMQLQLQNMLLAQKASVPTNNDEEIIVGCRIFNGAFLSSVGGDISMQVNYREEIGIKYVELREIFKSPFNYKQMFKKGTLYFADEENYKRFGITKEIDLSDESLKEELEKKDFSSAIEWVKKITNDKRDLNEVFALIYQIAYLIDNKKIDLDYEVRNGLERYFNVDFKDIIANLKGV